MFPIFPKYKPHELLLLKAGRKWAGQLPVPRRSFTRQHFLKWIKLSTSLTAVACEPTFCC